MATGRALVIVMRKKMSLTLISQHVDPFINLPILSLVDIWCVSSGGLLNYNVTMDITLHVSIMDTSKIFLEVNI